MEMILMICPNCGFQNNDGVAFCSNCGAPVAPAAQPQVQAQPVYQQPVYQQPVAAKVPGKGMGIASLVLGLCGILIYPLICGILAVSFGGVARSKGYKGGMATAGIVLGVIDLAFWLLGVILWGSILGTFM